MSNFTEPEPAPLPDARFLRRALALIARCALVLMYVVPALAAVELTANYVRSCWNSGNAASVFALAARNPFAPLDMAVQIAPYFFLFGFIWFFARYFSGIPESTTASAK